MKYVDYQYTPPVLHILSPGSDGKEKSETAPAKLCFITDDGQKTFVVPGTAEAEALMAQVKKNNPEPHQERVPEKAVAPEETGEDEQVAETSKPKGKKGKAAVQEG